MNNFPVYTELIQSYEIIILTNACGDKCEEAYTVELFAAAMRPVLLHHSRPVEAAVRLYSTREQGIHIDLLICII